MTLVELDRFIRDAAQRQYDQSAPTDGSMPRTRQEFADLCALVRAKVDTLKQDTTMPERPTYEGPPSPGAFVPSEELDALYRWLEGDEERLYTEYEHGRTGTYVEYLEREMEKRRAQIAPIERKERQKHEERVREYNVAREPYRRLLQAWQAEVAEVEKRRRTNDNLEGFVERAYRRSDWAFEPKRGPDSGPLITRDFEIAPPGERSDEHVRAYYREVVGRDRLEGVFSQDRFEKMLALPRSGWQKGKAGFYGYIVLMFDHTERVLLECPVEGNAIYLLDSGEDRLLAMNKWQLRESGEVKRIFHTGDWYRRLKNELGIE